MKTLKPFDNFNYELLTEESKFKDKLKFLFGNVGNKIKDLINKDEVELGEFANRAKNLNYSDFVEFIMRIAPKGKGIKNKEQISKFLKQITKYLQIPFFATSLFLIFYKYIPNIGEYMNELLSHDLTKNRIFASYAAMLYIYFGSNIISDILSKNKNKGKTDIQIKVEKDRNLYKIVFNFYYAIGVKNKYRILYNAFVRKLQEYEQEEGFEIKYGFQVKWNNEQGEKMSRIYPSNQHLIYVNFYPLEFVNILKDFSERKEYKFKQFTQNDTSHTLYIQELTDDDILYLADQIKNMVVRAHPIDEDIYI